MKIFFKRTYSTSVSKRSPEKIRHGFDPRTQLLDWREGEREKVREGGRGGGEGGREEGGYL